MKQESIPLTERERLKGTETEKNLMSAFIGESQARNKYTYFASVAKREGYEQISAFFTETADNEKEHAKIWFDILGGVLDTKENLTSGMEGEEYEFEEMYPEFARIAEEEGFPILAQKFKMVAEIERHHYNRYKKLLENMINDEVFKKKTGVHVWKCRNCGNIITSSKAPEICPVCMHPKAYYEINCENY